MTDPDDKGNVVDFQLQAVREAVTGAEPAPEPEPSLATRPGAAPRDEGVGKGQEAGSAEGATGTDRDRGGGGPGGPRPSALDPRIPVIALGKRGDWLYFLDADGEFREFKYKDLTGKAVESLMCAQVGLLPEVFLRTVRNDNTPRWDKDAAAAAFMAAAAEAGIFKPAERRRGRGCWVQDGALVVHLGGEVVLGGPREEHAGGSYWQLGRPQRPGLFGRLVYAADEPLPPPARTAQAGGADGPGWAVLETLKSWSWKRGELDAVVLFGLVGCLVLGGALAWRPMGWLTGGKGTGKSTLLDYLHALLGEWLVACSQATEAGIRQKLGFDTIGVVMDEAEADEDNRRLDKVVEFARQAASGGLVLKGRADHEGVEFVARSAMLFASILVPPLGGADRSRIAVLELGRIEGRKRRVFDKREAAAQGAALRRRLFDAWPWFSEAVEFYGEALAERGWTRRAGDVFGTILAAAHAALWDAPPDPGDEWSIPMVERLAAAEGGQTAEADDTGTAALAHLLQYKVQMERGGELKMIAEWVAEAALPPDDDQPARQRKARALIKRFGLRLETAQTADGPMPVLAVANTHQGLSDIYRGTRLGGGGDKRPVWGQALMRVTGTVSEPPDIERPDGWERELGAFRSGELGTPASLHFGTTSRATMLPLGLVLEEGVYHEVRRGER